MFVVSDLKRLRVYINVPQNYVPSIKIGATAAVSAPEYPGRDFPGGRRGFGPVRSIPPPARL